MKAVRQVQQEAWTWWEGLEVRTFRQRDLGDTTDVPELCVVGNVQFYSLSSEVGRGGGLPLVELKVHYAAGVKCMYTECRKRGALYCMFTASHLRWGLDLKKCRLVLLPLSWFGA